MATKSLNQPKTLNRNKTKVDYLNIENKQLKDQVNELKNLLQINRQALQITMNSDRNLETSKVSPGQTSSVMQHENTKAMNKLMNALYEENDKLTEIVN